MSGNTAIEWTDATWNPTTGCDRISPGCDNCYALTLSARLKKMGSAKYQKDGDPKTSGLGFGLTLHPDSLHVPMTWKKPKKVFVDSMSDLFHKDVPLSFIKKVFQVMNDTPMHKYQVLTKRSQRLAKLASEISWTDNIWMGVSIENQKYVFRKDHLLNVPAKVLFISAEPLLGPINMDLTGIHWVIAGGESGPNCRTPNPDWVRGIRDICVKSNVPFFFKQWGGKNPKAGGKELDGREWLDWPAG